MADALLVLEDGTTFPGRSFGAAGTTTGEVVFNTGMTGYQEVLTDPSYHGQLVTMTYPHVGNYGVNTEDIESSRVRVAGFVVREAVEVYSNHRATSGLDAYLRDAGIIGIEGVDTRMLTRHIRSQGAMRAGISTEILDTETLREHVLASPSMEGLNLVDDVTTDVVYRAAEVTGVEPTPRDGRTWRVAAYDFGIKFNILRLLAAHGCDVTVFPAGTPAEELLAMEPDGIFLSNGPGDPAAVTVGIENVRSLLGTVPIFGICLGHQILSLALGARTFKLPFGHRGINQPVKRLDDGRVEVTSHNHGFAVDPASLGIDGTRVATTQWGEVEVTHLNLNDDTCEGIRCRDARAFSVQYHPEAAPGPHDARYLFEEFIRTMEAS